MKTIKLEPYKSLGHITWEGKRHEIADIEQEAAFELGRVGKDGKMKCKKAYRTVRITINVPIQTND